MSSIGGEHTGDRNRAQGVVSRRTALPAGGERGGLGRLRGQARKALVGDGPDTFNANLIGPIEVVAEYH